MGDLKEELTELKQKTKCCVCEKPLSTSKHLNIVTLGKIATWENPTFTNLLVELPWNLAIAYVCDDCIDKRNYVKYAVERRDNEFIYHDIVGLKDNFTITEELVSWCENEGKPRYWGYGPRELRDVMRKFLHGDELTGKEASLIKWYFWQYYKGINIDDKELERMLAMDVKELHQFIFEMFVTYHADPL